MHEAIVLYTDATGYVQPMAKGSYQKCKDKMEELVQLTPEQAMNFYAVWHNSDDAINIRHSATGEISWTYRVLSLDFGVEVLP